LRLESVKERIKTDGYGTEGYAIDGLTSENAKKICGFGPESDCVGFFIASLKIILKITRYIWRFIIWKVILLI